MLFYASINHTVTFFILLYPEIIRLFNDIIHPLFRVEAAVDDPDRRLHFKAL